LSVTADRTFSIKTGLAASTVTPGSTAPDVSLTVPATALVCASATAGTSASSTAPKVSRANMRMPNLLLDKQSFRCEVPGLLHPACRHSTLVPGRFRAD
jgi:hypothetical protein